MKKNIPTTTLFMLASVDGKISTGDVDSRDFDKDLVIIKGVKDGLHQYYEIERQTDINSFNTGRVMAKIGVNTKKAPKKKSPCTFVILDNKPHLAKEGVVYLTKWARKLYLVTTNKNHPAFSLQGLDNLKILFYPKKIDLKKLFLDLKEKHKIKRITIQSGGDMNAELVRTGLVESLSLVVAPCLVGGKNTSTLMDGPSLKTENDLRYIKALILQKVERLSNSYLHLTYKVIS